MSVEERLLDAVYSEPDDPAARAVYADWLIERERPRGELMVLHRKRAAGCMTRKDRARERALVLEHAATWLGPLRYVINKRTVAFDDGFLAAAATSFRNATQRAELLEDPRWRTVERLVPGHPDDVLHSGMANVRQLGLRDETLLTPYPRARADRLMTPIPAAVAQELVARGEPTRVRELIVDTWDPALLSAIATGAVWPELQVLEVTGYGGDVPPSAWLLGTPLAERVRRLVSHGSFGWWTEDGARTLAGLPALEELAVVAADSWALRLLRSGPGDGWRLEVVWCGKKRDLERMDIGSLELLAHYAKLRGARHVVVRSARVRLSKASKDLVVQSLAAFDDVEVRTP